MDCQHPASSWPEERHERRDSTGLGSTVAVVLVLSTLLFPAIGRLRGVLPAHFPTTRAFARLAGR